MDLRDILLVLQGEPSDQVAAATAAQLAKGDGAVTGVCVYATPVAPMATSYAAGSAAISQIYDDLQREREAMVANAARLFDTAVSQAQVTAVWAPPARDEAAKATAARARTFDLTVVGRPEGSAHPGLIEELVFSSGSPCLIVPKTSDAASSVSRVDVAWTGSREATHALDAAKPFLRRADHVEIVTTEGSEQSVTDAQAEALLRHLARHDIPAQFLRIGRHEDDVAGALRRHCAMADADLLVMGAYSHSPRSERLFGGVTQSLLDHASVPILMAH